MSYPMVVACGCSFEKAEDCNGKQESNPSLMLVIGDFEGMRCDFQPTGEDRVLNILKPTRNVFQPIPWQTTV